MNTTINLIDLLAISPLLLLLLGGLILILVESFFPSESKKASASIALITLFAALFAAVYSPTSQNPLLTKWLNFDVLSRFFSILFICIGIGSVLLSIPFFKRLHNSEGEYYFLLLSALLGLLFISSAADFLLLFLGLETLSMALYILCGYIKKWNSSRESSTKYFLMGSLATAFLLYGIALVYGATGTTNFNSLLQNVRIVTPLSGQVMLYSGIAFITLGLAFKAAIVPMHTWAPDVYEGASNPVTAFMAVATKIGAFAALIRVFMYAFLEISPIWNQSISLLAYPTLIYANFVALRQVKMRRFFAYSGIAHAGLLLIPFAVGGDEAMKALLFYLTIYSLATLGCFAILAFLDHGELGVSLNDLNGLYYRSPLLALLFAFSLLTLAGIPPTAGFLAKFYVFKIAFQAGYYGLVIVGLLTAVLSAFYYLRITALMFAKEPVEPDTPAHSLPAISVAAFCLAGLLVLSLYPEPFLKILNFVTMN